MAPTTHPKPQVNTYPRALLGRDRYSPFSNAVHAPQHGLTRQIGMLDLVEQWYGSDAISPDEYLCDKSIVFTGSLFSMVRADAK